MYEVTKKNLNRIDLIDINTTDLEQNLLNIQNKEKSNNFTWKGQFSPQFVSTMLKKYAKLGDVILDPFSGSGTVLFECINNNFNAIGIELNPAAYYMTSFYELANIPKLKRKKIIDKLDKDIKQLKNEKQLEIFIQKYKYIKNERKIVYLFVVLLDIYNFEINISRVNKIWTMIKKIEDSIPEKYKGKIKALKGDIRCINIKEDTIDLVLTSPPYLNVFNYHQNYRKSVELLGYDVLKIAKTEFGSNRKNRSNRYFTVIQYFIDMALAINKLSKFVKNNSEIVFVIGRKSSVLGIEFCNSEILYRISIEIFNMVLSLRQERYYKNRFGIVIYEDILHFKNKKNNYTEENIISKARIIARDYLIRYFDNVPNDFKNKELLFEAIKKYDKIKESELLC